MERFKHVASNEVKVEIEFRDGLRPAFHTDGAYNSEGWDADQFLEAVAEASLAYLEYKEEVEETPQEGEFWIITGPAYEEVFAVVKDAYFYFKSNFNADRPDFIPVTHLRGDHWSGKKIS